MLASPCQIKTKALSLHQKVKKLINQLPIMKITMKEIAIREIVDGYVDNNDEGVVAYGGKLNVRPPYQREFCYPKEKQEAVIHTIMRDYPLNVMYWAENNDGTYEIMGTIYLLAESRSLLPFNPYFQSLCKDTTNF